MNLRYDPLSFDKIEHDIDLKIFLYPPAYESSSTCGKRVFYRFLPCRKSKTQRLSHTEEILQDRKSLVFTVATGSISTH